MTLQNILFPPPQEVSGGDASVPRSSALKGLMHLGRKSIYGGLPIYIAKDACHVWPAAFKQNICLTNNPLNNCDMSFLTHFGACDPFLDIKVQL